MQEDYKEERRFIEEEFRELAGGLINDPDQQFEVTDVEVVSLRSMTGSGSMPVFNIRIKTNNRAQLLGQVPPFKIGDHVGRFVNLYRGRLTEAVVREFDPDYAFNIDFDVEPMEDGTEEYVNRYITVDQALDEGILSKDDRLTQMMDEYGLSHLIIAGSTIITGPLAGGMENFESICEKYSFDSVLDSFCGSGAYSKIAVEHGADTVEAVDIDTRAATPNLSGVGNATVHEMDMFDFTASRDYDLFIADPYYELSPKFIQEKLPQIGEHSDYLFMTVASNGHWYWKNKVTELLSDHVEIIDEHNTGRIIQVFAEL